MKKRWDCNRVLVRLILFSLLIGSFLSCIFAEEPAQLRSYLLDATGMYSVSVDAEGTVVAGIQAGWEKLCLRMFLFEKSGAKVTKTLSLPRGHELSRSWRSVALQVASDGKFVVAITKQGKDFYLTKWDVEEIRQGILAPKTSLKLVSKERSNLGIREVESLCFSNSGQRCIISYHDSRGPNVLVMHEEKPLDLKLEKDEKLVDVGFLSDESRIYGTVMREGVLEYRLWDSQGKSLSFKIPEKLQDEREGSCDLLHVSQDGNYSCAAFCSFTRAYHLCLWSRKGGEYEFQALPFPEGILSCYRVANSFVANIGNSPVALCLYQDARSENSHLFCWRSSKWHSIPVPGGSDHEEKREQASQKKIAFWPVSRDQTILFVGIVSKITEPGKQPLDVLNFYYLDLKKSELQLQSLDQWFLRRGLLDPRERIQRVTHTLLNDLDHGTYLVNTISADNPRKQRLYLIKRDS